MNHDFDKARHFPDQPRWFEDFRLGERYVIPSRTVTEATFAAFQAVSGDNHPIHYDREHCRAHGFDNLLAHGLHVLCFSAAGAGRFPHEATHSLKAFLSQSCRFLEPVLCGDTLYPALTISGLEPQRTTGVLVMTSTIHNQRGDLVIEGEQRYLIRKRPA